MTDAAGNDEELAGADKNGTAVCFGSPDAEKTTEDEEHLILVFMRVPRKLSLDLRHFDVLVVDLTNDSRRPKLFESGTCEFQRDGSLLGLLDYRDFEFGIRRHRGIWSGLRLR